MNQPVLVPLGLARMDQRIAAVDALAVQHDDDLVVAPLLDGESAGVPDPT